MVRITASHALLSFGLLSLAPASAAESGCPDRGVAEACPPEKKLDTDCPPLDEALALRDAQITRIQADISLSAPLVPLCVPDFTYSAGRLFEIGQLQAGPGAGAPTPPPAPPPPGGGGEVGG